MNPSTPSPPGPRWRALALISALAGACGPAEPPARGEPSPSPGSAGSSHSPASDDPHSPTPAESTDSPTPEESTHPVFSDPWILAQAPRYLDDPAARRRALERSLTAADNIYARTRLGAYGIADLGWDLLPEWNPRVAVATAHTGEDLAAGRPLAALTDAGPLWDGRRPTTMPEWVELGRRVFFLYPLRPEVFAEHALAHPAIAAAIGLDQAASGEFPGAVAFVDVDGAERVGITCALCHSAVEGGAVIVGRGRRDLDYGGMRLAYHRDTGEPLAADLAARMASWGRGRADITEDDDEDPVAIPDLWRVRELGALTQAATLRHRELGEDAPLALAIRQETQLLHANRERARPPRALAWALAMYVYSLEPPPRAPEIIREGSPAARGQAIFARACAGCHSDPGGSGPPIDADAVGTDPALARGKARGTGLYRPAPLVRVAEAGPYLHHGEVASLAALFDPARLQRDYRGGVHGPGPIAGHPFGTDLELGERDQLIAYLETL